MTDVAGELLCRVVLACTQQLGPYLTSGGRSFVQGALGSIQAPSPLAIPLPGFRNMAQMEELVPAPQFGPLPQDVMQVIEERMRELGIRG